jgi:hypothetical protein
MIYNFGVTISQLQLILQLIITSTKHEANLTGNCQKYLVVTPLATGKNPIATPLATYMHKSKCNQTM